MKWENTKAYRAVKKSLLESLERRGLTEQVFLDKAEEYMALWVQFHRLKQDAEERGVTVFDPKRGMNVENRSVALGVQVSKQMLSIYTALGYKALAKKSPGEAGAQAEDLSPLAELLR